MCSQARGMDQQASMPPCCSSPEDTGTLEQIVYMLTPVPTKATNARTMTTQGGKANSSVKKDSSLSHAIMVIDSHEGWMQL